MSGALITKVITTRTEEHSVQQELKIPQELINHPRIREIIEHTEQESASQIEVLNLIPQKTSELVQQLLNDSEKMNVEVHSEQSEAADSPSKLKQMLNESEIHLKDASEEVLHVHDVPEVKPQGMLISKFVVHEGLRQLVICTSKKLNLAHVTTHIGYTKEEPVAIQFARRDLSKQRVTSALASAPDLHIEVLKEYYDIEAIKAHKRAKMLELRAEGWTVLGLLPKI